MHLLQKYGVSKIYFHIFTQFLTAYLWADSRRWSRPSPPGWGWAEGWRAGWCWSWRSPGTSWPRWARSCGSPASGRPGRKTGRCAAWAARTGGKRGGRARWESDFYGSGPLTFSFRGWAAHLIQVSFTEHHVNNRKKWVPNIHYAVLSFACWHFQLHSAGLSAIINSFSICLMWFIPLKRTNFFCKNAFLAWHFWFIQILFFFFLSEFVLLICSEFATSLDTSAEFLKITNKTLPRPRTSNF